MYLAHISEDGKREQKLLDHLEDTAELAEEFADVFGCGTWGYACGIMHDIGKFSDKFQDRLHGGKKVDHATAGAIELYRNKIFLAAYCVAGHHSGLPDGGSPVDVGGSSTLWGRLKKEVPDYHRWQLEVKCPEVKMPNIKPIGNGGFSISFFIRMIYSCLVDADFLNTEYFMKNGDVKREEYNTSMDILLQRLENHINGWLENKDYNTINGRRSEILRECLEKADGHSGLYSLTVPTGGGKTISSLAFALRHAVIQQKKRIIYVIPYTSIIEQTAEIFCEILGRENVLENHCNVKYESEEELEKKQLASENWDMPVIVTTNVQFFESFFANRSSRCRKIHNVANSVLIFDEAQMLPLEYLKPCVQIIEELVRNYGCTAVLCTATQPSIQKLFSRDLVCEEICHDVEKQYEFFRRNTIETIGEISEEKLQERLEKETQVLCILNSRKKVQRIYKLMEGEGVYHLSTLMYPEHRKKVLKEIRNRLLKAERCCVIATSLVEAGVDLDFPIVYREMAGVDSIIQAAGRCNREGKKSKEESKTYVFSISTEKKEAPPLSMRQTIEISNQIIRDHNDIGTLESIQEYFEKLHYVKGNELDKKNIVEKFDGERVLHTLSFPFSSVANEMHLIENETRTLIIDQEEEAKELIQKLKYGERSRQLLRSISRYCVDIYEDDFGKLEAAGLIEQLDEEFSILRKREQYSETMGLKLNIERGDAIFG